jgi:hypothetical protein
VKRIINGFEVDWASDRVFAEQQTAPNYGYLFEVEKDCKVRSHFSNWRRLRQSQ